MSYILDALKKADAQRERDPARGIHAHTAPVGPARARDAGSPWMWAGAAVVVAIVGGGAWALLQDRAVPGPAPVVASTSAPAVIVPPVAVTPPGPAVAPTAPAAAVPPASAPANEPVAAVVLPPPEPPRAVARVEREEEPPGSVRRRPRARVPVSSVAPVAPTSAASSAAPGVPPGAAPAHTAAATTPAPTIAATPEPVATGLPADAPKLAVTGGVYSANRAQRMLIVNGQVVNEGADLGGGVVLEEIKPKSAVLRFRGGRYSVAF